MDFKNERLMMSEEKVRNRAKELLKETQVDLITQYMFLEQQCKKQKEIIDKVAEYIEKHIKYECDDAYNGMQFYSYHLYDFNKQDLLDILNEVSDENNIN